MQNIDGDEFIFADEEESSDASLTHSDAWKIIIADDEEEIHNITRMVLNDFIFDNRPLYFLSAYTEEETKSLVRDNPDVSLILLDVVMDADDSGLRIAEYIRQQLGNEFIRIVLRTGQPGKAPEKKVVMQYDINDYKEKTELTSQKLYTTVTSALRAYRDMRIIEKNRVGLEQIINSSSQLFGLQSLRRSVKEFTGEILSHLQTFFYLDGKAPTASVSGLAITQIEESLETVSGMGSFERFEGSCLENLPWEIQSSIKEAISNEKSGFYGDNFVGYFSTENHPLSIIYLNNCALLSQIERNLIMIFVTNIDVAFDNLNLNREILDTQKEIVLTLGEVVETRSKETAFHVKRVAEFSKLLAIEMGIDEKEALDLKLAAPMHDVGKIGISDSILNKPGKLTPDEFEIIKSHTLIGYDILKKSNRNVMKTAAIVALQHHERWDGNGYPHGLRGEDIHIYGRIVALADVFDALTHSRIYKEAWDTERVIDFVKSERGTHFDPRVVDSFLRAIDQFISINNQFPDEPAQ